MRTSKFGEQNWDFLVSFQRASTLDGSVRPIRIIRGRTLRKMNYPRCPATGPQRNYMNGTPRLASPPYNPRKVMAAEPMSRKQRATERGTE